MNQMKQKINFNRQILRDDIRHHTSRPTAGIVREYVFYVLKLKNAFLRFFKWRQKHRKRYQVYQIARTLAYIVRSDTNT